MAVGAAPTGNSLVPLHVLFGSCENRVFRAFGLRQEDLFWLFFRRVDSVRNGLSAVAGVNDLRRNARERRQKECPSRASSRSYGFGWSVRKSIVGVVGPSFSATASTVWYADYEPIAGVLWPASS